MIPAINLTDGYKVDHRRQYPDGTQLVYSNFTPRKTRRTTGDDKVVFFGLQYFIKRYLIEEFNRTFFDVQKDLAIVRYKRRIDNYLGKGHGINFDHVAALHDLGYLPIEIKALPEGSVVDLKVPPFIIRNTRPEGFWLVNYFETLASCVIWGMCTSATTARLYRILLEKWAKDTVGNTDFVPFQGHDFSFRGMFGPEAAMMSGAGHLTSFVGTDTIPAIDFLEEYYNANSDMELIGCSVAATEHSVMCMGTKDDEIGTFKRLITEVYPNGIVSIVSDTWDLWKVLTEYLPQLKWHVEQRDGKVVIRPDSGDPVKILTGYTTDEWVDEDGILYEKASGKILTTAQIKGVVEILYDIFGGSDSEKGFKLLSSKIGTIYGDSITIERAEQICQRLADKGFASINWVAGIGSYTYQYVTRDTDGWAMKATYGEILKWYEHPYGKAGGPYIERREIFKDPITDDGTKKSAKGLLQVTELVQQIPGANNNQFKTVGYELKDQATHEEEAVGALKTVFIDGKITFENSLDSIRKRIKNHI